MMLLSNVTSEASKTGEFDVTGVGFWGLKIERNDIRVYKRLKFLCILNIFILLMILTVLMRWTVGKPGSLKVVYTRMIHK